MALTEAQRAALAVRLRQGQRAVVAPALAEPIVELGTSGPVPVYVVHAVGGTVYEYVGLSRELADMCRVYGIEAAGRTAGSTPATSLAEMVDRYAGAIQTASPAGPHHLIGWSMGGVLAFETARRLREAGQPVGLVTLIDAPYRTVRTYAETEAGLAALFVADTLRDAPHPAAIPATLPVEAQLDRLTAVLTAADSEPDAGAEAQRTAMREELRCRFAVFVAHTSALAGYLPAAPVDADAILVSAADTPDSAADWLSMFTGRVEIRRIEAGHHACLRPPAVTAIANMIKSRLGEKWPGDDSVRAGDRQA